MIPYAFYWILFIFIAILSHSVQANLDRKFKKYSQIPTRDGSSGRDVAQRMLADHGLTDVRITCVEGQLSDHYNPETNTVNLSKDVYSDMPYSTPRSMLPYRCARLWCPWCSSRHR